MDHQSHASMLCTGVMQSMCCVYSEPVYCVQEGGCWYMWLGAATQVPAGGGSVCAVPALYGSAQLQAGWQTVQQVPQSVEIVSTLAVYILYICVVCWPINVCAFNYTYVQ